MSDAQNTSEEVAGPTPPSVLVGPGSEGLFVGVMHKAGVMRTFIADGVEELWDRLRSIGVAEFGMKQDDAGDLASSAIKGHIAQGTLSDMYSEALQEIELLRGELGQAHAKLADAVQPQARDDDGRFSAPEPPPPTLAPDPPPPAPKQKLAVVPTQAPDAEGVG
jgi:hypothetical protein